AVCAARKVRKRQPSNRGCVDTVRRGRQHEPEGTWIRRSREGWKCGVSHRLSRRGSETSGTLHLRHPVRREVVCVGKVGYRPRSVTQRSLRRNGMEIISDMEYRLV